MLLEVHGMRSDRNVVPDLLSSLHAYDPTDRYSFELVSTTSLSRLSKVTSAGVLSVLL